MSNESETKRRKHTIAQTMRLHRLGLLLSSSCIVVMSWAAVVSCVVVAVVRIVVTVSCVVNVVVERERELTWQCVTNTFFLACGAHVTKWSVRSPRVYKP